MQLKAFDSCISGVFVCPSVKIPVKNTSRLGWKAGGMYGPLLSTWGPIYTEVLADFSVQALRRMDSVQRGQSWKEFRCDCSVMEKCS